MPHIFQVVDLFAGPGGLAEGFSSYRDAGGRQPFNIVLSIEKERSAHRTLQLRSFLRQFDGEYPPEYYEHLNDAGPEPDWPSLYPEEWANSRDEALNVELGTPEGDAIVGSRLKAIRALGAETVVIGGPPCQAYSIVGRVRNRVKANYVPEQDRRHFLYQEYIDILTALRPAAFVMENVKGILSSSVEGERIFAKVLEDLANAGEDESFDLFAIARSAAGRMVLQRADCPQDYVVRAEHFGVPQARHRVIIVGVRRDLADRVDAHQKLAGGSRPAPAVVRDVLADMPPLRSALTGGDSDIAWRKAVAEQIEKVRSALGPEDNRGACSTLAALVEDAAISFRSKNLALPRESQEASPLPETCPTALRDWLSDPMLTTTLNHSSRSHMADDLGRYFFAAVFAAARGRAPKAHDFPAQLAPAHANWSSGMFADRFRAQAWGAPSSTVTSHIAKDGHYFIHPDPQQCRALTVREAARLQTFPDNYRFLGNRTQQYVQVGNAVPPFLAKQIAEALSAGIAAVATRSSGSSKRPPSPQPELALSRPS